MHGAQHLLVDGQPSDHHPWQLIRVAARRQVRLYAQGKAGCHCGSRVVTAVSDIDGQHEGATRWVVGVCVTGDILPSDAAEHPGCGIERHPGWQVGDAGRGGAGITDGAAARHHRRRAAGAAPPQGVPLVRVGEDAGHCRQGDGEVHIAGTDSLVRQGDAWPHHRRVVHIQHCYVKAAGDSHRERGLIGGRDGDGDCAYVRSGRGAAEGPGIAVGRVLAESQPEAAAGIQGRQGGG